MINYKKSIFILTKISKKDILYIDTLILYFFKESKMKKFITLLLCIILTGFLAFPVSASVSVEDQSLSQSHLGVQSQAKKAKKILLIGNSYTWYNNLDQMLENICTSTGINADVKSITKGGASLSMYADKSHRLGRKVYQALRSQKWDYVVLQDRHFYPISNPERFYEAVLKLQPYIEAAGAKTVLYMTWAPADFCKDYQAFRYIVSGRTDYQAKIKEVYESTARETNAIVVPAGIAVLKAEKRQKDVPLLRKDGSHPSYAGSYVTACTIFTTLFPDSPDISYQGRLQSIPKTAAILCQTATQTAKSYRQPNATL